MLSENIKQQSDYNIVINMIENIINTNGPNGSIAFGKYYAIKYREIFNNMLAEKKVNLEILNNVLSIIDQDLIDVRKDCKRRIRSNFTDANNDMMSMIIDFVKSI